MKKCKKSISLVILLMFVFTMALSGCGSNQTADNSQANKGAEEIVIPLEGGDWGFPDPFVHQPRDWGGVYTMFIFDSLIEEDETGYIPWLAADWAIENSGKKYVFDLRKNVKWHDGQPFDADDVVFTFNYYKEKKNQIYDLSEIAGVNKLDEYKVEFELIEPSVVTLSNVFECVPIIPEHIWSNVDDPRKFHSSNPEEAIVGTGPYKMADYQQEHGTYKFVRNEDFWGGMPLVSEIITVPTDKPALSLLNGDIAISMISPQEIDMFKDKEEFVIEELKPYHHKWLCFNLKDQDLSQKEFRHALAYGIDKNELLERMYMGVGNPGVQGGIPMVHAMYNSNIKKYDYTPDTARQILEDMGYLDVNNDGVREDQNGNPMVFKILVMEQNARAAELVQIQLKKVGIGTEVICNDRKTVDSMTIQGDFQIVLQMGGYGGLAGDPDFLRSNFVPGEGSYHHFSSFAYDNPQFADLAEKQRAELDTEKRQDMIFQMQEIIAEDIPIYYLYGQGGYYVYNKNIYDKWFWPAYSPLLPRSKVEYCYGKQL